MLARYAEPAACACTAAVSCILRLQRLAAPCSSLLQVEGTAKQGRPLLMALRDSGHRSVSCEARTRRRAGTSVTTLSK